MKPGNIHQFKQQLYRMNVTRVRRTQNMPKQFIRKRSDSQQDEFIPKRDKGSYEEMLKEMSTRIEQLEEKRKQAEIEFIERYILKKPLTNKEKQKLMLYI